MSMNGHLLSLVKKINNFSTIDLTVLKDRCKILLAQK